MSSNLVERVGRALAAVDEEDYLENEKRYDEYARAALPVVLAPADGEEVSRIEQLEDVLRGLASYVASGGFSDYVGAEEYDRRIRAGIDDVIAPWVNDARSYRLLCNRGAAPNGTLALTRGSVFIGSNLDQWCDALMKDGMGVARADATEGPSQAPGSDVAAWQWQSVQGFWQNGDAELVERKRRQGRPTRPLYVQPQIDAAAIIAEREACARHCEIAANECMVMMEASTGVEAERLHGMVIGLSRVAGAIRTRSNGTALSSTAESPPTCECGRTLVHREEWGCELCGWPTPTEREQQV